MRNALASLSLLTLLAAAPALAQGQSRPTDAPIVTADNELWYVEREPIQFAGDVYYPAGAALFFDRNTMVRSGHFNGVPLYADTTVEPYSVVYVPVSRGLMQPYERLRAGALAGTTGSRAPSFPVRLTANSTTSADAAIPPTELPIPIDAVSAYTPEEMIGTSGRTSIVTVTRPQSNDGVWVSYLGEKWVSAGEALPFTPAGFRRVGSCDGFPVFARQGTTDQVIYLPTREGLVAPYRLKQ